MKKLNKELLKTNIEAAAAYEFDNHKVFGSAYCVMQEDAVIYKNSFFDGGSGNESARNFEKAVNDSFYQN